MDGAASALELRSGCGLAIAECGWEHGRAQGRYYLRGAGFQAAEESYLGRDFLEAKAGALLSPLRSEGARNHDGLAPRRGSLLAEGQAWLACRMRSAAAQIRKSLQSLIVVAKRLRMLKRSACEAMLLK